MKKASYWFVVIFSCLALHAETTLKTSEIAPRLYVTSNYGLRAQIPPNLRYCPLPEGWVGSDHGTVLFLEPPSECIPSAAYPSIIRPTPEFVPAIYIEYEHSVEIDRGNGKSSLPGNTSEVMQQYCEKSDRQIPSGLRLLRRQAVGCRHEEAGLVDIKLGALYWSNQEELFVTLHTTRQRLSQDLLIFAKVASGISECKPDWDKSKRAVPPCPHAPWW